jgi:hypothetical protein
MELATVWIEVDALKNNVKKENVTPAQAIVLRKMYGKFVQGSTKPTNPFQHIKITGEDKRTGEAEFQRLAGIYGMGTEKEPSILVRCFPGENPRLPETFKDAGIEETEISEPAKGVPHKIEPLTEIARGLTEDEAKEDPQAGQLLAVIAAQQSQVDSLLAAISKLIGSAQPQVQQQGLGSSSQPSQVSTDVLAKAPETKK